MAELIINRIAENLFEHILDGVQLAIDNNPNLTTFQNIETGGIVLHFKTKNGAPLVKNQEIRPQDITITDTFGGEPDLSGFTTAVQIWDYLNVLGYFIGYGGSGGGGGSAQYFKLLLDVFPQNTFAGQNGKVYVVNEANNRLEATAFYNYYRLTQMQDVESTPAEDIPNGYVLTAVTVLDENNVAQKLFGFRPQSIMSQVPNGFLTIGSFELVDGTFTADTGWTWSYNGNEYGNLQEYVYNIAELPAGSSRYIVFETVPGENNFTAKLGDISTDGNALKPTPSLGATELTFVFVNGDEIEMGGDPIIGAEYISKSSYGWARKEISGTNQRITYQSNANSFELVNSGLVSVAGFTISDENSYDGQLIWVLNNTGNTLIFINDSPSGALDDIPMVFPDGSNMSIAENGLVCFKRKGDVALFDSYNIGQGGESLDETLAIGNTTNKDAVFTNGTQFVKVFSNGLVQVRDQTPNGNKLIEIGGNSIFKILSGANRNKDMFHIVSGGNDESGNARFGNGNSEFVVLANSNGIGVTQIMTYIESAGTSFSNRQIPDWNAVTAVTNLKANDADVLHKTGNETKNGSLTVNSLLMVTPQMRIGNDSGYLQWIGLTNDLGDRRFTFESDPGVSSGKNFFIYAGGQLVQTWLESKSVFSKPVELGKYTNGTEPALIIGAIYFNTSINKMKVGGASGWEVYNAQETARQISANISSNSSTYQNNSLIGATSISLVIMNSEVMQPPFTFNSSTGTITMDVTAGDVLTILYYKN